MPKYITKKPKADDEWLVDEPFIPELTVEEQDNQPQATGLFDKRGNELFKVQDRPMMGFIHARKK